MNLNTTGVVEVPQGHVERWKRRRASKKMMRDKGDHKKSKSKRQKERRDFDRFVRAHHESFPTEARLDAAHKGQPLPSRECRCEKCRGKVQGWPEGYTWSSSGRIRTKLDRAMLMLTMLGISPASLDDLSHDLHCNARAVMGLFYDLCRRGYDLRFSDAGIAVAREAWKRVNAEATWFERHHISRGSVVWSVDRSARPDSYECGLHSQSEFFLRNLPHSSSIVRFG